ncbi:MAG: hypothetical protein R3C05_20490 [Pirellulaceae bacterium]
MHHNVRGLDVLLKDLVLASPRPISWSVLQWLSYGGPVWTMVLWFAVSVAILRLRMRELVTGNGGANLSWTVFLVGTLRSHAVAFLSVALLWLLIYLSVIPLGISIKETNF